MQVSSAQSRAEAKQGSQGAQSAQAMDAGTHSRRRGLTGWAGALQAMLLALTHDEKRCELVHKAHCRAARDSGCAPHPQKPPVFGVFGGVGVGLGWICGLVCGRVLFSESPPLMRKVCGQPPSSIVLENGSLLGVPVRVGLIFRSWLSRKR